MSRTMAKLALFLVGAHVFLGLSLMVIEATHGINDQDGSFAVALVFHYLNLPSVWLLRSLGGSPEIILVLLVGIVQWAGLAWLIAAVYHTARSGFRAVPDQPTRIAGPSAAGDADKPRP